MDFLTNFVMYFAVQWLIKNLPLHFFFTTSQRDTKTAEVSLFMYSTEIIQLLGENYYQGSATTIAYPAEPDSTE